MRFHSIYPGIHTDVICVGVRRSIHNSIRQASDSQTQLGEIPLIIVAGTGELGYDGLNDTRKIGLSYAKSVVYI